MATVILLCCSTVKPVTSRLPTVQISAWRRPANSAFRPGFARRADLSSVSEHGLHPLDGQGRARQQNGFFACITRPRPIIRRGPIASASTSSIPWRRGIGSHFQDPVQAGEWIHVVGVADEATTSIYKDGVFRDCDRYTGSGSDLATIIRRAFG